MTTKVDQLIRAKGLKKGFVAEKVGISRSALAKICTGETKEPKMFVGIKIARFLETTVEELWGDQVD